jgi:hypothetical protein
MPGSCPEQAEGIATSCSNRLTFITMHIEPELVEKMEHYLESRLPAAERIALEKQIAGSPALREELGLQQDIMRGIERAAWKQKIQQAAGRFRQIKNFTRWGLSGLSVIVIAGILFFYYSKTGRPAGNHKEDLPVSNSGSEEHATAKTVENAFADSLPSAEWIIDRYVSALGGKDAFEKITSRIMKGSYSLPVKRYTTGVEMYFKAPGKFRLAFTGSNNTAARGFDGRTGWSKDYSEEGLRILDGAELTADSLEAVFYRETNLKSLYPRMTVKGKDTTDGRDAWVMEAVPVKGYPETMYFDMGSGLLLRRDVKLFLSIRNAELHFLNYKEVNGVKFPFIIRVVRPVSPFMTIYSFDKAIINKDISDAEFAVPGQ